jgi:hypothetical protein
MYVCFNKGVNRGLKEYNSFIDSKQDTGFQELRDVTQKPRVNEPFYFTGESKANLKQLSNKNISNFPSNPIPIPNQLEKENYGEEGSAMID